MNKTNFKNVSNLSDEAFDTFPVYFHINRFGVILTNNKVIKRNIADEFNLKLLSCNYGADSSMYGYNPKMQKFIDKLELKYGAVEQFEDTLGFTLNLSFDINGKECIYFIGAGNNGQEISLGVYLKDLDTLDAEEFKEALHLLDKEMLGYIEECNLNKF